MLEWALLFTSGIILLPLLVMQQLSEGIVVVAAPAKC